MFVFEFVVVLIGLLMTGYTLLAQFIRVDASNGNPNKWLQKICRIALLDRRSEK